MGRKDHGGGSSVENIDQGGFKAIDQGGFKAIDQGGFKAIAQDGIRSRQPRRCSPIPMGRKDHGGGGSVGNIDKGGFKDVTGSHVGGMGEALVFSLKTSYQLKTGGLVYRPVPRALTKSKSKST